MKITVSIDKSYREEKVTVEAPQASPQVNRVLDFLNRLDVPDKLLVKKEGESYAVASKDFDRIYIENRKVFLERGKERYSSSLRLYELMEQLPEVFLQISQSEIINTQKIQELKQTPNGMVQILLKNGSETFSSRRYLKSIKEKLL